MNVLRWQFSRKSSLFPQMQSSEIQQYLKEVGEQVESAQLALKLKQGDKNKKRQSQSQSKKVN